MVSDRKEKRGQISLFIILGVILLFSAGIFIFINFSKDKSENFILSKRTPIENYVYGCIESAGEEAIRLLGAQGGYVKIPDQILDNTPSYISLDKDLFSLIPYWYHDGKTRIPGIESMEEGISRYVEEKMPECIDDFRRFKGQYSITILGNITAETKIGEQAVLVNIKFPFDAYDYKTEKKTFDAFASSFDVKLKKAHALAEEIMRHENQEAFLENITIDLMALDNDIPFTGLEFSCDRKSWNLADIKTDVQSLLKNNYPRIRFMNTDYMPFMSPEGHYEKKKNLDDNYEYFHFSILPSKNSYADLKASVIYNPGLGLDILARPMTRQGVLESSREKTHTLLNYLCIQIYHFTYDLYFPAIITIRDDSAFNRNGFVFRFATPVMIDHNKASRRSVDFEEMMVTPKYDPEFCSKRSIEQVEITATGSDGTYFGIELKDVNISYRCINLVCPLGTTAKAEGSYKLKTTLPSGCGYGTVIAEKPGYLSAEKRMTEDDFEISLTRLKTAKLSFREQMENSLGADKELASDETVVFYLSSPSFNYERQGYYDQTKDYMIDLIGDDATYIMDATLMKDDKIVGGFKGNITIKYADLEGIKEISFGVVKKSIVPILDDEKLSLVTYIEGNAYQSSLQPIFK